MFESILKMINAIDVYSDDLVTQERKCVGIIDEINKKFARGMLTREENDYLMERVIDKACGF